MDEALTYSVTKHDHSSSRLNQDLFNNYFLQNLYAQWPLALCDPQALPAYHSQQRDWHLRSTILHEPHWAAATNIVVTQIASASWEIEPDGKSEALARRIRKFKEILDHAEGGMGWVELISKVALDYCTTNNGAFIEIARAGRNAQAAIKGFYHLDSNRCTRTNNPRYPVQYEDLQGNIHELAAHQVIFFADMPNPDAQLYGVGLCAADRAYMHIVRMAIIEHYYREKIIGRKPQELHFVGPMSASQLNDAVTMANLEADSESRRLFMGVVIQSVLGDVPPSGYRIQLSGLPDNFDRQTELNIGLLAYANAYGLDPQELQPITGQAIGSGAQSQVLNDKAKGRGPAVFKQRLAHALNRTFGKGAAFYFVEKDLRDKQIQTQIDLERIRSIQMLAARVRTGVAGQESVPLITDDQARQLLVDYDLVPPSFIVEDVTPAETVSSDDNPQSEAMDAQDREDTEPPPEDLTQAVDDAMVEENTE